MSEGRKLSVRGFVLAALFGAALHFLYDFFPSALTAVFGPVNESVWEHGKLVLWPGLVAQVWLAKRLGGLGERMLSLIIGFLSLLALGYLYSIRLGGRLFVVNVLIYLAAVILVFWLPGPLEKCLQGRLSELFLLLVIALAGAVWLFSFLPPDNILFLDLSSHHTWAILGI